MEGCSVDIAKHVADLMKFCLDSSMQEISTIFLMTMCLFVMMIMRMMMMVIQLMMLMIVIRDKIDKYISGKMVIHGKYMEY